MLGIWMNLEDLSGNPSEKDALTEKKTQILGKQFSLLFINAVM